MAFDNRNHTRKSQLVLYQRHLALANLVNSPRFENKVLIITQGNVFHFFHSHCLHFGLSTGMSETANYAKIYLLTREDFRANKNLIRKPC